MKLELCSELSSTDYRYSIEQSKPETVPINSDIKSLFTDKRSNIEQPTR